MKVTQEFIGADNWVSTTGSPTVGADYVSFLAASQHLFSRGTVHITSSDPTVYPTIDPKYYSVSFDRKLAAAGFTYIRKIAASSPYASYIANEAVPGPNVTSSPSSIETYVTGDGFTTIKHPIGTASMLPKGKGGVVDHRLVVYGTANLRVVDASIIPIHFTAHPQATVYGIAEMAGDTIRGRF